MRVVALCSCGSEELNPDCDHDRVVSECVDCGGLTPEYRGTHGLSQYIREASMHGVMTLVCCLGYLVMVARMPVFVGARVAQLLPASAAQSAQSLSDPLEMRIALGAGLVLTAIILESIVEIGLLLSFLVLA
jgi:hypothetical protein